MIAKLSHWLNARTSYRALMAALLLEHIPGGAKWRYVWGSTLSFVFFIQLVTGVLLMTAYSPSANSAWSSVYFIQYEMDFGWFIRGLHHFGSQTMVVLLALHMLQVVIAGAHLPPREVNWWLGLLLMGCILGLSLTGYLLPWDQKGFWATRVATNIAGTLPFLGTFIQKFAVGGPEYGHATLTRFFALHVAILPPLVIVLVIAHIAVFRKQGITTVEPKDHPVQGVFWPDQVFKDLIACLVVFGVMVGLVVFGGHGNVIETEPGTNAGETGVYEQWAKAGREGRGADLGSPADPTEEYPARPEWYFLFLFQLLKYFEGDSMIVGTVIIPQGVGLLLFILPLLGVGRLRKFGHVAGVLVVTSLVSGVGVLTCLALADDTLDPVYRELLTLLGKVAVPVIGGVFLLHLALLAALPRNGFRTVVYGLGVLLLAALLGGSGFLLYAAQVDDERYAHREEKAAADRHPAGEKQDANKDAAKKLDPVAAKKLAEEKKRLEEDKKIASFVTAVKAKQFHEENMLPRQVWDYLKDELQKKVDDEAQGNHREQLLARVKKQGEIEKFHHSLKEARQVAERAVLQASRGIPAEGPIALVRADPMTQGRKLFKTHCAACHGYTNPKTGKQEFAGQNGKFTASDLGGFGSQEWVRELIEFSDKDKFFGNSIREEEKRNAPIVEDNKRIKDENKRIKRAAQQAEALRTAAIPWANFLADGLLAKLPEPQVETKLHPLGKMAEWSVEQREQREEYEKKLKDPETRDVEKARIKKSLKKQSDEFDLIAAWLASQPTAEPPADDDKSEFAVGYRTFMENCKSCHRYGDKGAELGPNMRGYGSPQWIRLMVMFPTHPERYPRNNAMPAFRNLDGPGALVHEEEFKLLHQGRKIQIIALNDIERELILRFMRQDDRVIFGGLPITGPPPKKR